MSKCGRRGYRKRIFSALQGERLHAGGVEGRECLHMKHASVMHEWMMKFLGNFFAFSALVLKNDITDWLENFFSKSTNLTCKFSCNRFVRNQASRSFANVQMHSCTCTFSTYTHVILRSKRAEYSRPSSGAASLVHRWSRCKGTSKHVKMPLDRPTSAQTLGQPTN